MLQRYLLLSRLPVLSFTVGFDAPSLIPVTRQSKPLQVCKDQTHRGQLYFGGRFEHVDRDTALREGDTKDWEKAPSPTPCPWDLYQQGTQLGWVQADCKLGYENPRLPAESSPSW